MISFCALSSKHHSDFLLTLGHTFQCCRFTLQAPEIVLPESAIALVNLGICAALFYTSFKYLKPELKLWCAATCTAMACCVPCAMPRTTTSALPCSLRRAHCTARFYCTSPCYAVAASRFAAKRSLAFTRGITCVP